VYAGGGVSKNAADIVAAMAVLRLVFPCVIRTAPAAPVVKELPYCLTTRSCNRVMASNDDRMAPSCHAGI